MTEHNIALNRLTDTRHRELLRRIRGLPFGDNQAAIYKKSIEELFARHNDQVKELGDIVAAYDEIALMITQRQPLINARKYARVRRIGQLNEL